MARECKMLKFVDKEFWEIEDELHFYINQGYEVKHILHIDQTYNTFERDTRDLRRVPKHYPMPADWRNVPYRREELECETYVVYLERQVAQPPKYRRRKKYLFNADDCPYEEYSGPRIVEKPKDDLPPREPDNLPF